jgi:hypothetical protein
VGSDIHVRVLKVNVRQDLLELVETYQPQDEHARQSTSGLPLGDAELAAADGSLSDTPSESSFDEEAGYRPGSDEPGTSNGASDGSEEKGESGAGNGHHQNGVSGRRDSAVDEKERSFERILVREAGS